MDGGLAVRLCRHRAGGRCAVGKGRLQHPGAEPDLAEGLSGRDRRRPRHDDHPLLFLLAILGGGGGRAHRSRRPPVARRARRGAGTARPHPRRHLSRDGVFQPDQPFHHHHRGGDAERAWHHRHPDLGAGGRGIAADRRRVRLCRLRRRHHRHRPARRAGAGRLRRLCAGRGVGLADRAQPAAARRQSVLRHDRGRRR